MTDSSLQTISQTAVSLTTTHAHQINASSDRYIEHLESGVLDRHLENIYLFKLGLRNTFGVDFRTDAYTCMGEDGTTERVLFRYLSEVLPLVQPQANQLPKLRRHVYDKMADAAVTSFWEVYYRFQPLIQRAAESSGVNVDDLGDVLGRSILLYEKHRGFKFYSYFEKTLRHTIKNLRGRVYAKQYQLPLSAGRLFPQLLWLLDQETLRLQRRLTADESDTLLIDFLRQHRCKFSETTMRQVALVVRDQVRTVAFDHATEARAYQSPVNATPDYEETLVRIQTAITKAEFSPREQAILFQRLDLSYDQSLYRKIESELSAGSLRNRRAQLMVRFMAAIYSNEAKHFGKYLLAEPKASKPVLHRSLRDLADRFAVREDFVIECVLNAMTLTESVYRLTIAERGRLETFLAEHPMAQKATINGALFHKLKAALIDQDRQNFPCIAHRLSD